MTAGQNYSQIWRSKLFRSKQVYHLSGGFNLGEPEWQWGKRGDEVGGSFLAYEILLSCLISQNNTYICGSIRINHFHSTSHVTI